ncbi:MAG: aminomethyl-transferring glycine dehydrogenase subunit GcvPA [Gammaproteobacteria bacterium]|nr:aminomethyl-transferring glycine dehydrogenase subunit GcvPA [Gammaproteobacteria bacterium]
MPFIPHTQQDTEEMLSTIGVANIENLFDEIPDTLRHANIEAIPSGITEMELTRLMKERAKRDGGMTCFIGAGAYEHHIPAAVWEIASRGEFLTAYTPYQAEASQGTLQLLYEYQTMMASLMGLDVSNASLYDGASALAEAVLMAVRANKFSKSQRVLMPRTVHPFYREVVATIVGQQNIELIEVPFDLASGCTSMEALKKISGDITALIIPQPNFFGVLEDVDALTDWAHAQKALVIAVVNPLAMSLLKAPGHWGSNGADIACGEGQPLGVPLASGGPYYGFLCCKQDIVRQLPGRIVGRTVDQEGKEGFVLTLQAREQHIRRAKATSNICTNQGLLVTASTIYMSLLGPEGLRLSAIACHQNTCLFREKLKKVEGVKKIFSGAFFHEIVLQFSQPVDNVLEELAKFNIQGGYAISQFYSELENCLLVCVTETKTEFDMDEYVAKLQIVLRHLNSTEKKAALNCEEGN